MSLQYPDLWSQMERDCLKVRYGKLTFEVDMQDGVPVHAAMVEKRISYICPNRKESREELIE